MAIAAVVNKYTGMSAASLRRVAEPVVAQLRFAKAEEDARLYLEEAKKYSKRGDWRNALSSLKEARSFTFGFPRYMAVRDEIDDLRKKIIDVHLEDVLSAAGF